jgi:hypothetical protein
MNNDDDDNRAVVDLTPAQGFLSKVDEALGLREGSAMTVARAAATGRACGMSWGDIIDAVAPDLTAQLRRGLLFIEPTAAAAAEPLFDDLTRRMASALMCSRRGTANFGTHTCVCGAESDSADYVLPDGTATNSLCVHYLAYHRAEVPDDELARVGALQLPDTAPVATAAELHFLAARGPGV